MYLDLSMRHRYIQGICPSAEIKLSPSEWFRDFFLYFPPSSISLCTYVRIHAYCIAFVLKSDRARSSWSVLSICQTCIECFCACLLLLPIERTNERVRTDEILLRRAWKLDQKIRKWMYVRMCILWGCNEGKTLVNRLPGPALITRVSAANSTLTAPRLGLEYVGSMPSMGNIRADCLTIVQNISTSFVKQSSSRTCLIWDVANNFWTKIKTLLIGSPGESYYFSNFIRVWNSAPNLFLGILSIQICHFSIKIVHNNA